MQSLRQTKMLTLFQPPEYKFYHSVAATVTQTLRAVFKERISTLVLCTLTTIITNMT